MEICCVAGCGKQAKSRGLCGTHYERMRLGKTIDRQLQIQHHGLSKRERFEMRVEKMPSGCWHWTGSLNKTGYGQFNLNGDRPILTHRASWLIYNGEIPANPESAYRTMYVLHRCDNPKCVNPEHLFLGSQQGNMDDKMEKGRHSYGNALGEKHGNAKLTADLVREIRASSETESQLSKRLGIARSSIYAARRRQTWKHVI